MPSSSPFPVFTTIISGVTYDFANLATSRTNEDGIPKIIISHPLIHEISLVNTMFSEIKTPGSF